MNKLNNLTLISLFILSIMCSSCKEDPDGYTSMFNEMGNNPARVIPWLHTLTEDYRKEHAEISQYNYKGNIYYVLEVYETYKVEDEGTLLEIYYDDPKSKVVFYRTDNVAASLDDELYKEFIQKFQYDYFLWRNRPNIFDQVE